MHNLSLEQLDSSEIFQIQHLETDFHEEYSCGVLVPAVIPGPFCIPYLFCCLGIGMCQVTYLDGKANSFGVLVLPPLDNIQSMVCHLLFRTESQLFA